MRDISSEVSSAYQAFRLTQELMKERSDLEAVADQALLRLELLLKEQADLLREAKESSVEMAARMEASGKESRVAKRHAVWANIIAVIALAFAAFQYLSLRL